MSKATTSLLNTIVNMSKPAYTFKILIFMVAKATTFYLKTGKKQILATTILQSH